MILNAFKKNELSKITTVSSGKELFCHTYFDSNTKVAAYYEIQMKRSFAKQGLTYLTFH